MIEYIEKVDKNGRKHLKVKFHKTVKRFKRVETLKLNGHFYNIYVNKYNCVHNLERTEVVSWKEVEKGKRKIRIPDVVKTIPESELMNKIRGNHYNIAIQKIRTELEKENI